MDDARKFNHTDVLTYLQDTINQTKPTSDIRNGPNENPSHQNTGMAASTSITTPTTTTLITARTTTLPSHTRNDDMNTAKASVHKSGTTQTSKRVTIVDKNVTTMQNGKHIENNKKL